MELQTYKNSYGWNRVKCPFCDKECYISGGKNTDQLKGLKRHILNEAKLEALDIYLNTDQLGANKHAEYLKNHAKRVIPAVVITKFTFDDDLSIKEEKVEGGGSNGK